jgi:hypothetical protein
MSWQVNFQLKVYQCSWDDVQQLQALQKSLHEACVKVIQEAGLQNQVGLSSADCSCLN